MWSSRRCTCTSSVHAACTQRARRVYAGRVQGVRTLLEEAARAVVKPVADGELLSSLEGSPRAQRKGAAAGGELGGGLGGVLAEVEEGLGSGSESGLGLGLANPNLAEVEEGDEGEGVVVIRHGEAATRHLVRVSSQG